MSDQEVSVQLVPKVESSESGTTILESNVVRVDNAVLVPSNKDKLSFDDVDWKARPARIKRPDYN